MNMNAFVYNDYAIFYFYFLIYDQRDCYNAVAIVVLFGLYYYWGWPNKIKNSRSSSEITWYS